MEPGNEQLLSLLLADDDSDDRMFFQDAVSGLPGNITFNTVSDGVELMHFLLSSAAPLPDMLFLDLNMPLKNGYECLKEIRSNVKFKDLIIIIYSTTASPREIAETFEEGANLFINKPNTFSELKQVLAKVIGLDRNTLSLPEKSKFILETQ